MSNLRVFILLGGALLAMLVPAAGRAANPLTVVKTMTVVSDPLNETLPKAIPGALLDYTDTITNPTGGASNVTGIAFADAIPAKTKLIVTDLNGSGSGPVVFSDGGLILGLLGSNLTYSYSGLGSTTDRLDFSNDNGAHWDYVPVADADGADGAVTNIRVRPSGTQAVGSYFRIRFRVEVR
ncbi:hypothetical protein [Sphingomonas abietis]|uniref:DUF4402 domain-containing protein n=1 Tax=Sphingomonas abietis TaxID=3012344 RepID=A0ABY7NRH2_9SPHN|nr:hypothetical protein [Sphingomonas abietis]WBO23152.1 hypothetical protein PBT88_03150 [Sphingomonas abietis]